MLRLEYIIHNVSAMMPSSGVNNSQCFSYDAFFRCIVTPEEGIIAETLCIMYSCLSFLQFSPLEQLVVGHNWYISDCDC